MADGKHRSADWEMGEFNEWDAKTRRSSTFMLSELIQKHPIEIPKHSHKRAFFDLLINGNYAADYDGKNFSCNSMSVLWCPPEVMHTAKIGKDGGHFLTIEIGHSSLRLLEEYSPIPRSFLTKKPKLVSLAMRLFHEFKNWENHSTLTGEGLTLEMLGVLAHKEKVLDDKPPKWLLRIAEKLDSEFTENPTTRELASEAGVHPVHLAKVFRKFYGQTINEHIQNLRVNYALRLLRNIEMPLTEVAALAGFSDQSHLTRTFKRLTSTTPGAFRDSLG